MPLMVLPPGPMMRRIWSGLTLMVVMRGAYFESSVRGAPQRSRASCRGCAGGPRAPARAPARRIARERPAILMSIWMAVMPLRGAADLEVHVAEVVFVAEDVAERMARALSPSVMRPIAMPATGRLDRDARVHERERAAADRRHRRRAVRLERLGDDADRVRELLLLRDHAERARARRGRRGRSRDGRGRASAWSRPSRSGGKL